jgi:UDP-N-acetylmuramate: L-alanyl-gamma-D-glutamyl-meso-diaminopimelate ligase
MSTQLENQGITLIEGFDPYQTNIGADMFVIGNVVSRGNPLMEEILNRGLPYISGPQWLAEHVLRDKWVLGVAGTHGKTTTSSMLAWILEYANMKPGFLIGGVPQNFGISARLGETPFFVIEADEYDTAFFDKRSKFVHYHPRTAILNNLEFDHADIFPDLAAIETQFHHLVRTVPGNGLILSNSHETSLERVLQRGCWTPVGKFGTEQGWQACDVKADGSCTILYQGQPQGQLNWQLLGEHNRMNALAAIAAARHAGVPADAGIAALGQFQNVKRRMEVRGVVNNITVYDDFAHHPTAIATTIAGLRAKVGKGRILAVLEPRSNTMKLGAVKDALPGSLKEADLTFCYANNLGWDAQATLQPLGASACTHDSLDLLIDSVAHAAKTGDHILVMSNGGFGGIHEKLLKRLAT